MKLPAEALKPGNAWWTVRRSRFPLAGPAEVRGLVQAPTRRAAEAAARELYGTHVCVEPRQRSHALPPTYEAK